MKLLNIRNENFLRTAKVNTGKRINSDIQFNCKYHQKYIHALKIIRKEKKTKKGESQNGSNKETKHAKFSEKMNISYPLIHIGFFGKFGFS